ncbi:MAG: chordopoxvirus fusion protein [Nitrospirae bacterium]|nr:chordopoxvirus fusion protein [Nitrospirota bacterium]
MIDTLQIYEELKDEITPSAAKKIAEAIGKVYSELLNTVTKEEFRELRETVAELAEAQKKTEEELKKLVSEHRKTREQLGGLTHTVGYILEDRAYRGLPELLKRDFGIEVTTPLKRDYIELSPGRYEEVNIIGRGRRNGQEVLIVGECKTQLKKADIDSFIRFVKKVKDILPEDKILLTVTYQASPPVREYAKQKGIKLYFSYEMPI